MSDVELELAWANYRRLVRMRGGSSGWFNDRLWSDACSAAKRGAW